MKYKCKTETTIIVDGLQSEKLDGVKWFTIHLNNSSDKPNEWYASLVDYDDNVGAVGRFSSKDEFFINLENFLELALPAYREKHAKYGRMPEIFFEDGKLVMKVETKDEYYLRLGLIEHL